MSFDTIKPGVIIHHALDQPTPRGEFPMSMDTSPEIMSAIHELSPDTRSNFLSAVPKTFPDDLPEPPSSEDARSRAEARKAAADKEAEEFNQSIEAAREQREIQEQAKLDAIMAAIEKLPAESRKGLFEAIENEFGLSAATKTYSAAPPDEPPSGEPAFLALSIFP